MNLSRALEELNANFNKLIQLPETIGFELLNLKKLSVNSNKLVFLPRSTSHLTSLKVLDVRLNCLRSLPEDLENLINLEILNISQNFQYLNSLPYSIGLLLSLVELDVSYNKIKSLPDSIGCLKKLHKLSVEGNPLTCPPPEVVEQGLHAVKEYLCHKMNNAGQYQSPTYKKKSSSWVGKLVKYGTFNGHVRGGAREEREAFILPEYRSIDALASPRYMGMFSPRRLFSPRNYFSNWGAGLSFWKTWALFVLASLGFFLLVHLVWAVLLYCKVEKLGCISEQGHFGGLLKRWTGGPLRFMDS